MARGFELKETTKQQMHHIFDDALKARILPIF
jgi:hypothetical protein